MILEVRDASRRLRQALLSWAWCVCVLSAGAALGSDGRLEINQTCAIGSGCFVGDAPGFPVTITAPGSYLLTGDLAVAGVSTHGIEVTAGAGEISIDLNGFAIRGGVTCTGSGSTIACTSAASDGVSGVGAAALFVHDGVITGFGYGIRTAPGIPLHGRRLLLAGNSNSGVVALGAASRLADLVVEKNQQDGVSVSGSAVVTNVAALGNGWAGVRALEGAVVSGSTSTRNGQNGFSLTTTARVSDSFAQSNAMQGFSLGPGSQAIGCVSTGNDGAGFSANHASIAASTSRGSGGWGVVARESTVRDSTVEGNSDGILLLSSSFAAGNSVFDNTGIGIDATSGGRSDVRGNSVRENGGVGLLLVDAAAPDAAYKDNLVYDNGGGTVTGGNNRGGNDCRNNAGVFTSCP